MKSESLVWTTRSLIYPTTGEEPSHGLQNACSRGIRHFAANGRTVDLSEAAKVAREIRQSDLEKEDGIPLQLLGDAPKTQERVGAEAIAHQVACSSKGLVSTVGVIACTEPTGTPAGPKLSPITGRGERHFDGVNCDSVESSLSQFREEVQLRGRF